MKKPRDFECVAFKRRAQARIYSEIKGLSADEEIAYFRRRVLTGPFAKLWKRISSTRTAKTASTRRLA